jgi:RNA polymerase sigma-70 factor (ECF subfamily)
VLRLNRAIASWHVHGADSALAEVDALEPQLADYRLWHATRGALLRDLGRDDEARAADQRALELATNTAERELLRARVTHQRRPPQEPPEWSTVGRTSTDTPS